MSRSIARSVPGARSPLCIGTVVTHLPHAETKRACEPFLTYERAAVPLEGPDNFVRRHIRDLCVASENRQVKLTILRASRPATREASS